jgi:hypothetical protein
MAEKGEGSLCCDPFRSGVMFQAHTNTPNKNYAVTAICNLFKAYTYEL